MIITGSPIRTDLTFYILGRLCFYLPTGKCQLSFGLDVKAVIGIIPIMPRQVSCNLTVANLLERFSFLLYCNQHKKWLPK